MKAVALDFGGTHVTCAVVDDRRILASETLPVQDMRHLGELLPAIEDSMRRVAGAAAIAFHECAGVAVSFPGICDPGTNRVLSTPKDKYSDSTDIDLDGWSRTQFELPVRLENDARMALLGEHFAGAGRECDDLVMLTLGTGVGGAAMIEGHLLRGKHFQAGCLGGHLTARYDGRLCGCGGVGCVEAEASGWALPAIARDWPGFPESFLAREPAIDFEALFRLAARGDRVAQEVRERCLHVWASGIVSMIHAYDPELVILGGSVMTSADQILPFVSEYVTRHSWTPWGKVRVHAAQLGNDAALLGSIPLLSRPC